MIQNPKSECSVCNQRFNVQFRYQVRELDDGFRYYCSQLCQQQAAEDSNQSCCTVCRQSFTLEYPYQVVGTDDGFVYYCSTSCRRVGPALASPNPRGPRRIAVFNHKGGTGKTTSAVNLAAGLAETGRKVLLVDADGQGNVGASLGIRGEQTLYHVIVSGADASEVAVPVRPNLDVLTSNESLAAAELYIAARPNRDRILRERLADSVRGYDVVVIDCAPALSLMNQNVLMYADSVLIPVGCDYLSLLGVKQVLRTLKSVRELLAHEVKLLGVLPTFYDKRNRVSRDAIEALQKHFGDRCLPPIRVNIKLSEAPTTKQTIFEFAPDSNGAADYRGLVRRIRKLYEPAPLASATRPPPPQVPVASPPAHVPAPRVPAAPALPSIPLAPQMTLQAPPVVGSAPRRTS